MSTEHTNQPAPVTDHRDGYEKRDVAVGKLLLVTIAATMFVAAVLVVLFQFFTVETEQQVYNAVLAPESVPLRDLRAREDEILNSYAVVDSSQGIYRIPIEQAMKIIADEAFQNRATQEGQD